jgi:protein tyrosine phosphatase
LALQEVCHQYWPRGRGNCETYGKYSVTLTKLDVCNDYVIRKMDIMECQSQASATPSCPASFTVTQFQYMNWPEDSVPQSTTGILEVANLVQKVQMSSGNKAIVVMCRYINL